MKKSLESALTTNSDSDSEKDFFRIIQGLIKSEDVPILSFLRKHSCSVPSRLIKSTPKNTRAVSVTNHECQLQCAHCRGHYLKGMLQLKEFEKGKSDGASSFLISGGSDKSGAVPIAENMQILMSIPSEVPLNIHTGFQNSEKLLALKGRPVTVSFDMVGDEATIRETFGLKKTVHEIQEMYLDLARHFHVVPHITIGLNRGRISGEREIIEFLKKHPAPTVTFLVFRPTPGTPFEDCKPPSIEETVKIIFLAARELKSAIKLGCMRPAGEYRRRLDPLAWVAGAETIVHPDRSLVKALLDRGVPVEENFDCCSLGE